MISSTTTKNIFILVMIDKDDTNADSADSFLTKLLYKICCLAKPSKIEEENTTKRTDAIESETQKDYEIPKIAQDYLIESTFNRR